MKKFLGLLLSCTFLVTLFTGCGGGTSAETSKAPTEAQTSSESGASTVAGGSKHSVGFALRTTNGDYYASIGDGVKAACAKLGWQCTVLDSGNDTSKELENMETLVAAKADLIFLDCVDPSAATASQKVASEAGIPIINLDSGVDDMSMQVTTVYSDNKRNGIEAGKYYAGTLSSDYQISAILLSGNTGSIAGKERRDGLMAGIIMQRTGCTQDAAWASAEKMEQSIVSTGKAKNAEAKFEITGQGWGNWTIDQGLIAAEDLITANPKLNLVLGENDSMLLGALTALDKAGISYGKDGTVKLIAAADGSRKGYDRVKDQKGSIMAIGENSPVKIGELGMKIAQDILVNGKDPKSYDDITMTEAVAVTSKNVDEHYKYGF